MPEIVYLILNEIRPRTTAMFTLFSLGFLLHLSFKCPSRASVYLLEAMAVAIQQA